MRTAACPNDNNSFVALISESAAIPPDLLFAANEQSRSEGTDLPHLDQLLFCVEEEPHQCTSFLLAGSKPWTCS